jgi:DNA-binding response OmpR family regulator
MSDPRKKIPAGSAVPEKLSVHLITPNPEDTEILTGILGNRNCNLTWFRTAGEADGSLSQTKPAVVLCERDLPDGSWKQMLERIQTLTCKPILLVMSRFADDSLWAEVLNLGGYDVLSKPLDETEVVRVVEMACRNWTAANTSLTGVGNRNVA